MNARRPSRRSNRFPHISDAELTVMNVVWKQSPITANQVVASLAGQSHWKPKTIHTLLSRLVQKKALTYDKQGREYLFRPSVEELTYKQAVARSFLRRVFEGGVAPFLCGFLEQEKLSPEDIEELQRILKEKEK